MRAYHLKHLDPEVQKMIKGKMAVHYDKDKENEIGMDSKYNVDDLCIQLKYLLDFLIEQKNESVKKLI